MIKDAIINVSSPAHLRVPRFVYLVALRPMTTPHRHTKEHLLTRIFG
jgi:hypothetical protein